jgi:LPS-assembly protein
MSLPIHPQKPLLLPLVIGLLASPLAISAEKKSDWDCLQDKVTGEWSCSVEAEEPVKAVVNAEIKTEAPVTISQPQPAPQQATLIESSAVVVATKQTLPGWNCKADNEQAGWDCNLTGVDPQGELHLPKPPDSHLNSKEQLASYDAFLFQNMLDVIPQDPWGNCGRGEQVAPAIVLSETTESLRQNSAAYIEADFSEALESDEVVTFSGNVDFKRADQTIRADKLTNDQLANTISAQGNVLYRQEGVTFQSEKSFMWLNSDQGKLYSNHFIFETIPARGSSQLTTLKSKTLTRHHNITYTTCKPGNQDWQLEAEQLTLDKASGVGTANAVWVHFKQVPLFYTPWVTFPIDDRRKSGLLMPSFGSGDETGFDLSVPYYWNIAPNYDAIITPRYLSNRGLLLGTEFRYLTSNSEGIIAAEYLHEDKETEEARGQINWESKTRFTERLTSNFDINLVSDDDYLDDFGNSLSINDTRHLLNRADLNYQGNGWSLLGRLDGYQTIDHDVLSEDQPYRRLPQILFNLNDQAGPLGSQFNLQSEFVYFDKGDRVTGKRLNIKPEISFPLRTAGSFITPTLALQSTQYWLEDQPTTDSDSINRTLPILSVDSGLFFERNLQIAENSWQQTLEPRLFYLFVPNENQDDIPIFDSGEYDFTFNQLFRHNRFSGTDRINDANQLTAALTTRFIESETGRERLRASIGQIFYFRDREVTLSPTPTAAELKENSTSSSDLVTELDALLTDHWSLRTAYQWSPHQGDSQRASASVRYRDGSERLFNLSYQFREELLDQTDVSLRWPIADSWHGIARWNYSLSDEITLDSFLGVEKENCCWRFKVLVRHSVDDIDSEPETAFFFQIELKGLTSFGAQLDQILSNEIPGYQLPRNR